MLVKQLSCGLAGKIKSANEGRIHRLFGIGLKRVRRDLDVTNAVKTYRRTKSMAHTMISEKQRLLMDLDKHNLLNSEDSDHDPRMTDYWSTSDGETIE